MALESSPYKVEKVTATSTTSPRTEEERAIQNACDKKRKKRVKSAKDWKNKKTELPKKNLFEAVREQETSNRLSQDLPNCNWLEQKIKQSGGNSSSSASSCQASTTISNRNSKLFSSDSEEESLVVDEVFDENGEEYKNGAKEEANTTEPGMEKNSTNSSRGEFLLSPPCITIAEDESQQPIQIRVSIQGEPNELNMDSLGGFHDEGNQNISREKDDGHRSEEKKEHEKNNEKLKELIRIKSEVEKDIESLKNKKIREMEELLEIKTCKERSMNELEELRLDVYREKNLLESLRQQRQAREAALERRTGSGEKLPPHTSQIQTVRSQVLQEVAQRQEMERRQDAQRQGLERKKELEQKAPLPRRFSDTEGPLIRVDVERPPPMPGGYSRLPIPEYSGMGMNQVMSEMYRHAAEARGSLPYLPFPPGVPWAGRAGAPGPAPSPTHHVGGRGRASGGHPSMGRGRPGPPGGDSQCAACGALANFMCSACKAVHYCSTECQRGHWVVHTRSCQPSQI